MRFCEIEGCNRKHRAKGLCRKHSYQKNKEKEKKQAKQWYINNKEERAKYRKQWYKDNSEYNKKYRIANKDFCLESCKQYRKDNKECISKYRKQWLKTPTGKASIKASRHNHRTLLKGLTKETILRVYADNIKKYGVLTCYLCFKIIVNNDDILEHSTPLSRGGSNDYDNLGVAHRICNNQKNTMTLDEWKQKETDKESSPFKQFIPKPLTMEFMRDNRQELNRILA